MVIGIWMILHSKVPVRGREFQKSEVDEQARETIEVCPSTVVDSFSGFADTPSAGVQKLRTLLDDIGEAFDSLPAEVSLDYLTTSRYFSSISEIGQYPLLSSKAVLKLTEYALRVKSKKRVKGEEWDVDAFSKILRMVERVMREGDDLPAFRETRNVVAAKNVKKGKKSSQSPDLDNKSPVESQAQTLAPTEDQLRLLDADMLKLAAAGSAAVCALTLLDLDGLPKQVGDANMISDRS